MSDFGERERDRREGEKSGVVEVGNNNIKGRRGKRGMSNSVNMTI